MAAGQELIQALRRLPLLNGIAASTAEGLVDGGRVVHVTAGSRLFSEGQPADGMYLVLGGRLRVESSHGELLRVLQTGDAVGELALLTQTPRSATVTALRDTRALLISRESFLQLLDSDTALVRTLVQRLAEQLQSRAPAAGTPGPGPVLALVHLQRNPGELRHEVERFLPRTHVLDGSSAEGTWPQEVERAEQRGQRVLLDCGADSGPSWREFALRTADTIAVVASSTADPDPRLRGCDILAVRLGPGQSWPTWATRLEPRRRHRLEGPESVEAFAHRLSASSPGAVLSGGGARGMAHLGVLAGLESAGLRPQRWGGCSMGAFVAALAADRRSPGNITDLCRQELVRRHPFRDVTLPRHALSRGRRLREMLARVFGEQRIEDLREDYYCVTADLISGTLVVHRSGLLREVVAASMAVPLLAPPVRRGAGLLVDGGVLDNLPVGVMAATGEGPVIAIDVMRRSGAALQLGPPSLFDTVCQALTIGGRQQLSENLAAADAVVTPDLGTTGLLEFDRLESSAAAGAVAVRRALPSLRPLWGEQP